MNTATPLGARGRSVIGGVSRISGPLVFNGTLHTGDVLYVPRGHVHHASSGSASPSLHYTISAAKNMEWVNFLEAYVRLFPRQHLPNHTMPIVDNVLPQAINAEVPTSAFAPHLDLSRAPYCYVLYGVKYIDLVSLGAFVPRYFLPQAINTRLCPTIFPIFLPHFRLYEVVSLHMCVLPYKYRKILEMLLKLMKLCFINGEQADVIGGAVRTIDSCLLPIDSHSGSVPAYVCRLSFVCACACLSRVGILALSPPTFVVCRFSFV